MIYDASKFLFTPPPLISRARRILLKPAAGCSLPNEVSTSKETLGLVINKIKQISDADIIVLDGTATGESIYPIYKELHYDFPRVLLLDVKDSIWVEVENPLPHPFAVTTFWVPNVVLSSDYLISITPYNIIDSVGSFTIKNLFSLLPIDKYKGEESGGWGTLEEFGLDKVIADLYFTIPFDLGIIDARQKNRCGGGNILKTEKYGKMFVGEPFDIDREAMAVSGLKSEYIELIDAGKAELETWG